MPLQQHGWTQTLSDSAKSAQKRKTNAIRYHFHVESKMGHKQTYLQNRNRLSVIENRHMLAKVLYVYIHTHTQVYRLDLILFSLFFLLKLGPDILPFVSPRLLCRIFLFNLNFCILSVEELLAQNNFSTPGTLVQDFFSLLDTSLVTTRR